MKLIELVLSNVIIFVADRKDIGTLTTFEKYFKYIIANSSKMTSVPAFSSTIFNMSKNENNMLLNDANLSFANKSIKN